MKHYAKAVAAALEPGDEITALEGLDLGGEKAVVVSLDPGSDGTTTLTLLFPRLKASKKFVVPDDSLGTVEKRTTHYTIPDSVIDTLRSTSPDREVPVIRDNLPDSYFPPDPNGTQPSMTDTLWRPTIRRSPQPRLSTLRRQAAEAVPQEGDQFFLLVDVLPFRGNDSKNETVQKKDFKAKLERGLEKAFSGKKDLSYTLKYVGTKNEKEYHVFITFNSQKAAELGSRVYGTVESYWAPEENGLKMVLYKSGPVEDGKLKVEKERSKPVYAEAAPLRKKYLQQRSRRARFGTETVGRPAMRNRLRSSARRRAIVEERSFDTFPATMAPPADEQRPRSSTQLDSGYADTSSQRPRQYNRPYEYRYLRSQDPVVDPDRSLSPEGGWKNEEKLRELADLFWSSYKEMQLTKLPSRPGLGHGGLGLDTWATIWLQETGISVEEMDELWQYLIATRQATATAYRAWRDQLRQNELYPLRTPLYTSKKPVVPVIEPTPSSVVARRRSAALPKLFYAVVWEGQGDGESFAELVGSDPHQLNDEIMNLMEWIDSVGYRELYGEVSYDLAVPISEAEFQSMTYDPLRGKAVTDIMSKGFSYIVAPPRDYLSPEDYDPSTKEWYSPNASTRRRAAPRRRGR